MKYDTYVASHYGKREEELRNLFIEQMQDAREYFYNILKPRYDEYYKLYTSYTGDRAKEIKDWQSNVFVPYTQSVVETLVPRIIDGRPDLGVWGRNEEGQLKAEKLKMLLDFDWERSKMDATSEDIVRASLIYGISYLQVYWKKDVRNLKFLSVKDINSKKYVYKEKEKTFYDAPYAEYADVYSVWYDWHNIKREDRQYWFKRLILTEDQIKRRYPMANKDRIRMAIASGSGDLTDYAEVRNIVKVNDYNLNGTRGRATTTAASGIYTSAQTRAIKMYEVFEWWRPFSDEYGVIVGSGYVPIFPTATIPNPYDFKEAPFIDTPYLRLPGESEAYGLPAILKNPQLMLNTIKNQRLDAAKLSIHKMWIVNPLANIKKEELVTRPFGIIWSPDPNGVREVQFSDIKASAYKEEDLLKSDMRYASGVDDSSMGVGGTAGSATEVRHLRESTLERVRLFINHLGDTFSVLERWWIDMHRQFSTEDMTLRIIGDDGKALFPIVQKDDLQGEFDYKATVLPAIAGMQDIEKKQNMDLFQLLINLPFIDPQKLTSKVLSSWGWSVDSLSKNEEGSPEAGMAPEGTEMAPGATLPAEAMMAGPAPEAAPEEGQLPEGLSGKISPEVYNRILSLVNPTKTGNSMFSGLTAPNNNPIFQMMAKKQIGNPPTVPGIPVTAGGQGGGPMVGGTTNPRGFNRGGKVNTNIRTGGNANPESALLNRSINIQK